MSADYYLKNAQIATEENVFTGGIVIADGKIVQLVAGDVPVDAAQVIDLGGKHVLPGLVDAHVHLNEPGREETEGYRTGSMAAAAGGVTTVLDMPLNASPPTIDVANLQRKRAVAQSRSVVDYAHWGGLVNNNLAELDALNEEGVIGFKAFMSESGVDFARIDDDVLMAALHRMVDLKNVVAVHAENEYVTRFLAEQLQRSGRTDAMAWPESRPTSQEIEAIARAIYWAGVTGGRLHIVHISNSGGVQQVTRAKGAGIAVTAETCPHYLFFDHTDFQRIGPAAKCAPPLRDLAEVEELWRCVLAGQVDIIASDHSPCQWAAKEAGQENIWKAWGGINGLQSGLAVLLTEGVHKRGLPLPDLVRMMCTNPARIFGLFPQKGTLLPGSDADLVVVDLEKEWTLTTDDLFYKNKHSAYVGTTFRGAIEQTYLRGQPVYQNGQILVEPGYGKLVRAGRQGGRAAR